MIAFIKGKVVHVENDHLVIENNGMGYKVFSSLNTISEVSGKDEAQVYTEMIVRDDSITLVGFSTPQELKVFHLLTSVSGVGTKVGIGILSSIPAGQLVSIIMSGDVTTLTKAQGVGKKTASRIVLELKDKIEKTMGKSEINLDDLGLGIQANSERSEAMEALETLGYTNVEIQEVLGKIDIKDLATEEIIKIALKELITL